jgi:predicted transposase YbfD/YdcC
VAENQPVFAQVQTEAKSNEITAIPVLLEQIAIAGCIITMDAEGVPVRNRGEDSEKRG